MIKKTGVERNLYVNYLKRAEECLFGARAAFEEKKYDLCAIDSVHCGISSADALCVYFLECRHTGEKHEEVVELIKTIKEIKYDRIKALGDKIVKILRMKNMAEYEERSVKPKEAESLLQNAQKLFEMVKEKLS